MPPELTIEIAVEPKTEAAAALLEEAAARLSEGDESLDFKRDLESGQWLISGVSEFQLDLAIARLIDQGIEVHVGAPQVAYRETLGRAAVIGHTHKRLHGGSGEFARVELGFEPGEPGSGFVFENQDGQLPQAFASGVLKGLESARQHGLLAGFPVIDFKATLVFGAVHDLDSSVLAFEIAARAVFKALQKEGAPVLLEPVMRLEILTPDDCLGDVIADVNARRGEILSVEAKGDRQDIVALVPMSNLFGHWASLRGLSQGRAEADMAFDHYRPVPLRPTDEPGPYGSDLGMRLTA